MTPSLSLPPPEIATLAVGPLRARIWPGLGGTLIDLAHEGQVLTQPLESGWEQAPNPSGLGFFAMTPWFSRIAGGLFPWQGGDVKVPPAPFGLPDFVHGLLRTRPLATAGQSATHLVLTDDFHDARTAYRFRADLAYALDEEGISVTLTVTNRAGIALPFAIGFHPFFARTAKTRVGFKATSRTLTHPDAMPHAWRPALPEEAAGAPRPWGDLVGLNHSFAGWDGAATIEWPEFGLAGHLLAAGDAAKLLHVYVPADRPLISLEPVGNLPDVLNNSALLAENPVSVLEPGGALSASFRLALRPL